MLSFLHLPDKKFEVSSGGKAEKLPHPLVCSRYLSVLHLDCFFILRRSFLLTLSMADIEYKNEQMENFRLLVLLSLCLISLLLLKSLLI